MMKDLLFVDGDSEQDYELVKAIYSQTLVLMHRAVLPGGVVKFSVPQEKRAQVLGKIGLRVFAEILEVDHMIALDKTATSINTISHGQHADAIAQTKKQQFADMQKLYEQHKSEFSSSDAMCQQIWNSCILAAECDTYSEYKLKCTIRNIAEVLVLDQDEFDHFSERRNLRNALQNIKDLG